METLNEESIASFDSRVISETIIAQMSSIVSAVFARKMRLGGPESQQLVLQSLTSTGGEGFTQTKAFMASSIRNDLLPHSPVSSVDEDRLKHSGKARRYSSSQLAEAAPQGDVKFSTHTDQFLQMLSAPGLGNPSTSQTSARDSNLFSNLEASADLVVSSPSPTACSGTLPRQVSSPALFALGSSQREVTPTATDKSRNSNFVRRLTQSTSSGALSALAEQPSNNSVVSAANPPSSCAQNNEISPKMAPVSEGKLSSEASNVNSDFETSGNRSGGFGIFAQARKFGGWLGKLTEGKKLDVTKKDVNVFAPTSF